MKNCTEKRLEMGQDKGEDWEETKLGKRNATGRAMGAKEAKRKEVDWEGK